MNSPVAGAGVASPCTSVCVMDPATGYCLGCLRTLDEIATWGALADVEKRAVWLRLDARRAARNGVDEGGRP